MLKLLIQIVCDDCRRQFVFVRESDYTTDALGFNTTALSAMLPGYHWQTTTNENESYHFCMECCYKFCEDEGPPS
mgnify:CR=1 FL=1